VIRYHAADTQVANVCIRFRNDEIQRVTGGVGGLGNVLDAAERMQQLHQT